MVGYTTVNGVNSDQQKGRKLFRIIISAFAALALLFVGAVPAQTTETEQRTGGHYEPTPPEWSQPTCDEDTWTVVPGSVKIPDDKKLTYTLDGESVKPGSVVELEAGKHVVKAFKVKFKKLIKVGYWKYTIKSDPDCEQPPVPNYGHEVVGQCGATLYANLDHETADDWLLVFTIDGDEYVHPLPADLDLTPKFDGPGSGSYEIVYWLMNVDGTTTEKTSFTVDCGTPPEPVTPVEPTVTQPVCDENSWTVTSGFITIPETEHVTYLIDGVEVDAGTYERPEGTYEVTAVADDGYVLDNYEPWTLVVDADPECVEPPVKVTPDVPTTVNQTCDASGSLILPEGEGIDYYLVDGEQYLPQTVELEPGDYTVEVVLVDGYVLDDEADSSWTLSIEAVDETECITDPEPEEIPLPTVPTYTQPVCVEGSTEFTSGTVTIVETDNVTYALDGETVESGSHDVAAGEHVITAFAAEGYVFEGGNTSVTFDFTIDADPECVVPDPEPEPDPDPDPTEEPTPDPSPDPSDDPDTDEDPDELPDTGSASNTPVLAGAGLLLLIGGAAALYSTRRSGQALI